MPDSGPDASTMRRGGPGCRNWTEAQTETAIRTTTSTARRTRSRRESKARSSKDTWNPRNHDCLHRSDRHRSEEYSPELVRAYETDELMHRAVHQDEHEQDDLNGPEMRPHHFAEQLLVACNEA